jgi:hypothetical protein
MQLREKDKSPMLILEGKANAGALVRPRRPVPHNVQGHEDCHSYIPIEYCMGPDTRHQTALGLELNGYLLLKDICCRSTNRAAGPSTPGLRLMSVQPRKEAQ